MIYVLFILGFLFLIKGASVLVDGSSSIAKRLNISNIVIGLTIVSFGTSAPELIINILASINGETDIAIGNILGSNIANILLILGVAGLIYPLTVHRNTVWKEIPLSLLAAIILGVMANSVLIDGIGFAGLTRTNGIVLLTFFIIFMYYTFGIAKNGVKEQEVDIPSEQKIHSLPASLMFILLGLLALAIGGQWVVDGAIHIATIFGLSTSFIGLTVIAIGTSLPELFTSAVAAFKRNTDIAIGNAVGSNIFNIFWILGISAIINPIPFKPFNNSDIGMAIFASLLLFTIMFIGKRHTLERWQGGLFIVTYIAYIVFLLYRG
jgi:cation:H+ antiporter